MSFRVKATLGLVSRQWREGLTLTSRSTDFLIDLPSDSPYRLVFPSALDFAGDELVTSITLVAEDTHDSTWVHYINGGYQRPLVVGGEIIPAVFAFNLNLPTWESQRFKILTKSGTIATYHLILDLVNKVSPGHPRYVGPNGCFNNQGD